MKSFLLHRFLKLSNMYLVLILIILEPIAVTVAYSQNPLIFTLILCLYLFLPYLFSYKNTNKILFHISRGLFTLTTEIFKRKMSLGKFYCIAYIIIYFMSYLMIITKDILGIIIVILLVIFKILLAICCYYYSVSQDGSLYFDRIVKRKSHIKKQNIK